MEPQGLFNRSVEYKEEEIPIIIRAEKDASHIIDIMKIQSQDIKNQANQAADAYNFIEKPFQLAACIIGVPGHLAGKSGSERNFDSF